MPSPFKGGFKITQKFGERPDYYKQFGLAYHEGEDIVPLDADWNVQAVESGEVVRDIDNPLLGAYGNHVVVLNRETRRAWWYCHLAVNTVSIGQQVKAGQSLGWMGKTGNADGAHLHLGLRMADAKGNAINLDNGTKGFIDPLPVMVQLDQPIMDPAPTVSTEEKRALDFLTKSYQNMRYMGSFEGFTRDAVGALSEKLQKAAEPPKTAVTTKVATTAPTPVSTPLQPVDTFQDNFNHLLDELGKWLRSKLAK